MTSEPDDFTLHAWVDESVHTDVGLYVLASAVAETTACEAHRDALRPLARASRGRTHWKFEDDKDKTRIVQTLSGLDLSHLVAVASPIDPRRQERARRKCLERLMPQLTVAGVTQVWFESRTRRDNQRDIKMVDALRSRGFIDQSIRIDFAYPLNEPMLWIPDAVAGAVSAARKGRDRTYRDALGPVDELDVAL